MTPQRALTVREATAAHIHSHALVVDGIGSLQGADDAAHALDGGVHQRSLTREPIMFSTNQPLNARSAVLRDEEHAEALLDRV